jgi:glycosyltransferase involved in cell wall biosynthesis
VHSYDKSEYYLIDITKYPSRFLNFLHTAFQIPLILLLRSKFSDPIYFTCSRTFQGSIRDIILLLLSRIGNRKVINHLHGADFDSFIQGYPKLFRPILLFAYQAVDSTIVLTQGMKKEFESLPAMKTAVVPNCYPREFDTIESIPSPTMHVCFFSNLLASKGIFDFLEAAKSIHAANDKVKFMIAGSYMSDHLMSASQVKELVQTFLKMNNQIPIDFVENLAPVDRLEFLKLSSILVLPSYYPSEGFPLVFAEAMRCGNAIVTTEHNYLTEIISKKNGAIVPIQNPSSIASVVLDLLADMKLLGQIHKYNCEYAIANYAEDNYIKKVRAQVTP